MKIPWFASALEPDVGVILVCAFVALLGLGMLLFSSVIFRTPPYVNLPNHGRIQLEMGRCTELSEYVRWHLIVTQRDHHVQAVCVPYSVKP